MRSGKYPVARMENFKMKRSVVKWLMGLLCTLPVMYVWAMDAKPVPHTPTTRELLGEVKVPKDFKVTIFAQPPDITGASTTIAFKDVVKRGKSETSIMPEGIAGNMTMPEFASLLAYLQSLKGGK